LGEILLHFPEMEEKFISQEIERIVKCGTVIPLNQELLISSPIHIVLKKNGKFQLVIDMRYLNSHLKVLQFKMKGLEMLSKMLEPDDYMFMVNFQDGYHYINMYESAIPYLGFQWKSCYYVYRVMSHSFTSHILKDNVLNRISFETTGTQNTSIFRQFYRLIKKQIADVKKKISGITERSWTIHLKGKVKFRAETRKKISWSNGQDSKQAYILRTEQEENRSHQRDIKAIKEKFRAPTSLLSSKSSWSMYLPVLCSGTNKIANEESVQRHTEKAQLERENSVIRGSHSRSNMVERCNGILEWKNHSTIESKHNYIHRCQQLRLEWSNGSQIGERILDPSNDGGINQFSRVNGNIHVTPDIQGGPLKQSY
jgi:hypothetical protein